MNDLKIFLLWVFVIFTIICVGFCIEAYFRYRPKTGIDSEQEFGSRYEYFGQPIYDDHGKIHSYELLLREFNHQTKRWQLPHNVMNFPLSKIIYTIRKIDPQMMESIQLLGLNMTVSQVTDFRAAYFFKWVRGIIGNQQLSVEIDAVDIQHASMFERLKMRALLKKIDHTDVKVTIENVDSTKQTYRRLKPFLPYIDYLKFNIRSFKKSANHWIDITLAQWQQRARDYGVVPAVSKVEEQEQVALVNQLDIGLRQGYAYGQPGRVRSEVQLVKNK